MALDIKTILFCDPKTAIEDTSNFIILTAKYYIWRTKFQENAAINFNCYKSFLKFKLDDLKNALDYEGKQYLFDPWLTIYDLL